MSTEDDGSLETAQPDTLHADIAAAMDETATTTPATTETTPEPTPEERAKAISDAGRTLASARAKAVKEGDQAAVDAIDEVLEAPQHWAAEHRELFGKQPKDVQKFVLERHKAMESDYTRKTQELSATRRFKEQLDEILGPFREVMTREGLDDAAVIRQLVGAHAYLQRDPQAGIQWLAQRYGIDLSKVVGGTGDGQPDPHVAKLQQVVTGLQQTLESQQKAREQQEFKANLSQVQQFADEKDAQGQLKHPHFAEVAEQVVLLIKASHTEGKPLALQDAYDSAVWASPSTRAKVLQAEDVKRRAKEETDRKAKADAAKKASFDVSGQGAATAVAAKTDSLRADLTAVFDAAEGRV